MDYYNLEEIYPALFVSELFGPVLKDEAVHL